MSNRDNKAATAEFRELVGMDFDEFTRQAPGKVLVALSTFAERSISRFCDSPAKAIRCFQQQRETQVRTLRAAWQRKDSETAERRRLMTETVRNSLNEGGQTESGRDRGEG